MRKVLVVTLAILCLIAKSVWAAPTSKVDEADRVLIREAVASAHLEDLVPLLFVIGPPGDAANFSTSSNFDRTVRDMKLGGFILNSYHYWSSDTDRPRQTLHALRTLNNELLTSAPDRVLGLPPLMMVDYESFEFSSLNALASQVPHLPSAQALASTRDYELIQEAGNMTGVVLKRLGFNVLLGPVLDIQKPNAGRSSFSATHTRSFSSDRNALINTAANLMFGINETGILTIGKHLPGLGAVSIDPHTPVGPRRKDISKVFSPIEVFLEDLEPFAQFMPFVDGYMTSHVGIDSLGRNLPVTVDRIFINEFVRKKGIANKDPEFVGLGAESHLIVTDDVSDMGSLIFYQQTNDLSWPLLVRRMIEAGHDIVLISHLNGLRGSSRTRNGGNFSISTLEETIEYLTSYARENREFDDIIRSAAHRVLVGKLAAYRSINPDYNLSDGAPDPGKFEIDRFTGSNDFDDVQILGKRTNLFEFEKRLVAAAFTHVSGKTYSHGDYFDGNAKVCAVVNPKQEERYRTAFRDEPNFHILVQQPSKLPNGRNNMPFSGVKTAVEEFVRSCDIAFLEVVTRENTDMIDHLRLRGHAARTVPLIHTSVLHIDELNFGSMRAFGTFSNHPASFEANIDFIRGRLVPNSNRHVPIPVANRQVSPQELVLPDAAMFQSLIDSGTPVSSKLERQIGELSSSLIDARKANDALIERLRELEEAKAKADVVVALAVDRFKSGIDKVQWWHIDGGSEAAKANLAKVFPEGIPAAISKAVSDGLVNSVEVSAAYDEVGQESTQTALLALSLSKRTNPFIEPLFLTLAFSLLLLVIGIWLCLSAVRKMRKKRTILNIALADPRGTTLIVAASLALIVLFFISPKTQIDDGINFVFEWLKVLRDETET